MARLMIAVIAIAALTACAQTNYQAYEGRNAIIEGQGGTKEVIDGFEIWDNGNPPRRYKVIGVATIEDFDNVFGRRRIQGAIADQIRQAGGDAAVVLDGFSQGQSIGYAFNSRGQTAFGASTGRKQVRYQIIKYLDAPPALGIEPAAKPASTWIKS